MKCSSCKHGRDPLYSYLLLVGHIKESDTAIAKNLDRSSFLCKNCLFEALLDSQWSIGWGNRYAFLEEISKLSKVPELGFIRVAATKIFSNGINALGEMCIGCDSNINSLILMGKQRHVIQFQKSILDEYHVKHSLRKHFGLLLCEECLSSRECDFLSKLPRNDLPLYINGMFTKKGQQNLEKLLKGGQDE